jgi:hypothetical protein
MVCSPAYRSSPLLLHVIVAALTQRAVSTMKKCRKEALLAKVITVAVIAHCNLLTVQQIASGTSHNTAN